MTLGAWPVPTVDDAQRKAKGALGAASEGRDPAAEKQERKAAPTYDEVVERAAQKEVKLPAGLTDVRIHHLPHTFVSMLVSSGVPLCVAGRLAGHTQIATTQRYAHLAGDRLRQATSRLGMMVQGIVTGQTVELCSIPRRGRINRGDFTHMGASRTSSISER